MYSTNSTLFRRHFPRSCNVLWQDIQTKHHQKQHCHRSCLWQIKPPPIFSLFLHSFTSPRDKNCQILKHLPWEQFILFLAFDSIPNRHNTRNVSRHDFDSWSNIIAVVIIAWVCSLNKCSLQIIQAHSSSGFCLWSSAIQSFLRQNLQSFELFLSHKRETRKYSGKKRESKATNVHSYIANQLSNLSLRLLSKVKSLFGLNCFSISKRRFQAKLNWI